MTEFSSPKEYAEAIKKVVKNGVKESMDPVFLDYWCHEIDLFVSFCWQEYILGNRDTYHISEDDMKDLYETAGRNYVSEILDGMVDQDILKVSVAENGEMLYGLTEKGKEMAEKVKKGEDE